MNTNERILNVAGIQDCQYGIQVQTVGGIYALNSTFNAGIISDCTYGVCLANDGSSSLQGNIFNVNFLLNNSYAIAFLPISGATNVDFSSNVFNIGAIENAGSAGTPNYCVYSPSTLTAGEYTIYVADFFGNGGSTPQDTVLFSTPAHSNVNYDVRGRFGSSASIPYSYSSTNTASAIGTPATFSYFTNISEMFGTASSPGATMNTSSGRSSFNGGLSPYSSTMVLTCPSSYYSGLGSVATFYGYSWLLRGNTPIQARVQQYSGQFIVVAALDNSSSVANEFVVQVMSLTVQTSVCNLEISIGP